MNTSISPSIAPGAHPAAGAAKPNGPARAATGAAPPERFAQALDDAVAGDASPPSRDTPPGARDAARGLRRPGALDKRAETRPVAPRPETRPEHTDGTRAADAAGRAEGTGAAAREATVASPEAATALLAQLQHQARVQAGDGSGRAADGTSDAADAADIAAWRAGAAGSAESAAVDGRATAAAAVPGPGAADRAAHRSAALLAGAATLRGGARDTGADAAAAFNTAWGAATLAASGATESQTFAGGRSTDGARADAAPAVVPLSGTALAAAGVPGAANVGAPAEATLQAPPGSATFGAELGARITTFVRQGIEHATLQLNPAELGPVQLQIQIDGSLAAVHLSAELPATRDALEQALPELAGSLRDAGLTLTGGGVFQQPRQDGGTADPRSGSGTRRSSPDGGDDTSAALDATRSAAAAPRRRGVVDLVA